VDTDLEYLRYAIRLARQAQQNGNLPIGAVIRLDDKIVAAGRNFIWVPEPHPGGHAEIAALKAIPIELLLGTQAMTLYTTLEPCLMCASTILVYHIGRVVFGACDKRGGASYVFGHLPPHFQVELQALEWIGPVLPQEWNEHYETALAILTEHRMK
jgi:tRNA(adenine34) deaminase